MDLYSICQIAQGIGNEYLLTKQTDIIYKDEYVIALKKVYKCDGVSSRQHNEPCRDQDVWHYHLHVFPRYKDDKLYLTERELSRTEERIE